MRPSMCKLLKAGLAIGVLALFALLVADLAVGADPQLENKHLVFD